MISIEVKEKIVEAIKADRKNYKHDIDHARRLGIDSSRYSTCFSKGKLDGVFSDEIWVSFAMILKLTLKKSNVWKTANTPTYDYIWSQLTTCQQQSVSLAFCDEAGIGKTYTASQYVKEHADAKLIDCSQVKSKQKLVRKIAQEFGAKYKGKYTEVYENLAYTLNNFIDFPLVILDEAGDLQHDAFLELKGLWNATVGNCGWYMMGADGLKKRIDNAREHQKVGFAEMYDRYGAKFQNITMSGEWQGAEGRKRFNDLQIGLVCRENAPGENVQKLIAQSGASLRRLEIIIKNYKRQNTQQCNEQ